MKRVLLILLLTGLVIAFSLQEVVISDFNQKTVNVQRGENGVFIKISPSVLASLYQLSFQINSKAPIKTYSVFDSLPDEVNLQTQKIGRPIILQSTQATQVSFVLPIGTSFKTQIQNSPSVNVNISPNFMISVLTDYSYTVTIFPNKIGGSSTAYLDLRSDPPNATVYVDNKIIGLTSQYPLQYKVIAGKHTIKFVKPGYATAEKTVYLNPGQNFKLTQKLYGFGRLVVNSTPAGALVYLDNNFLGTTPLIYSKAPSGQHILTLTKEGYSKYQTTISIREYSVTSQNITMGIQGTIYVTSDPMGAAVYVDGVYMGDTPLKKAIAAGNHDLKLSLDKYLDVQQKFKVNVDSITQIDLKLQPAAYLTLTSTPQQAFAYLNGKYVGKTPLNLKLQYGKYKVKFVMQNHSDFATSVVLDPFATEKVSADMQPVQDVDVTSDPTGADVVLDGKLLGQTPITLRGLTYGQHLLIVKKDGYVKYSTSLIVNSTEKKVIQVSLTPFSGELKVYSNPSMAEVYLDNVLLGYTPFDKNGIAVGEHTLKIVKDAYNPWEQKIVIKKNITQKVVVDLTRLGTLKLTSLPFDGAKVYIDGIYRGDTPLNVTLPIGTHKLLFKMEGYSDKERTVTLMSGDVKTINVDMRDTGYLTVVSDPLGANVYLDGAKVDITPMQKRELVVGPHQITIKYFNYQPYTSIIQISKDKTLALSVKLKPVSSIEVDTFPSGATVYLDDNLKGQSPILINDVYSGNHVVRVEKNGYIAQKKSILIGSGENRKMYFYLKEAPLNVDIDLTKSGGKYVITYTPNKLSTLSAYIEDQTGKTVITLFEDRLVTPNKYTITKVLDLPAGTYSVIFAGKAPGGVLKTFKKPIIIQASSIDTALLGKITGVITTILALLYIITINNKGGQ